MPYVYYNENDTKTAAWLQELINQQFIPDGFVDTRSIWDVASEDLEPFTQHHFFAGIGGWAYALQLAGWPDNQPVWTGSCPCQPFSSAGKGAGFADERHLWPAWHHLIRICKPSVIFGEQVEAAINHGWLDLVQDDLEGEGYAFGSVGLPAAGVGAPHIRGRVWFVADNTESRLERAAGSGVQERGNRPPCGGKLGHHHHPRLQGRQHDELSERADEQSIGTTGPLSGIYESNSIGETKVRQVSKGARVKQPRSMGDPDRSGEYSPIHGSQFRWLSENRFESIGPSPLGGQWGNAEWLRCADDKLRPVEPGTFPLAHGVPARVGRLRGYGNAIVPQVAAEVIQAYMEISNE